MYLLKPTLPLRAAFLLAALVSTGSAAYAKGAATRSMPVSVRVQSSCSVQAQPLAFGLQPLLKLTNIDATASILVRCGANIPFTVALDLGQHANGTNRRVNNSTWNAFLNYEVFSDAPRTRRWGLSPGSLVSGNSGPTGQVTLTAFGRVSNPGIIFPGAYTDSVTVTINF